MADKLPKIRTAYEKLQADEPEREPTVAELMEKSGENQEHVEYALSIFRLDSWSLDWLIDTHGEDDGWLRRVRDEAPSATPLTLAQRVRAVVDQLDDRARLVIYTFYGLSNDAVESSLEPGQTTTSAWYAGLRREEVQRIKAAALCHLQRTYYSELQDCLTAA